MFENVYLIIGPMFAGKSTKLIEIYNDSVTKGKRTIVYKPTIDNRSQNITTHDGSTIKCQLIETPYEIYKNIQNYDVFLFDEFQFFQTYRLQYDLYNKNSFIKAIETLNFYNKEVFIFGLNFDHKGRMFSIMQELLQNLYAKNVTVLYSKCSVCSERAEYSKRLIDNDAIFLIGGAESYEPRCFKHFFTNQ
jgi:thymidine kinase